MTGPWHLFTGEYPPRPGGVSDYSALLAAELAQAGDRVHVWTTRSDGETPATPGVVVNRPIRNWSAAELRELDLELLKFAPPRRLLFQYTPNAWGYKGLNFGFCRWLQARNKLGDDVRLMVHEPFYPWRLRDKPTRWMLAAGQRRMMGILLQSSSSVYIAIPAWEEFLRRYDNSAAREMIWLPICSTIPVVTDSESVSDLRNHLTSQCGFVVGSFGTFGGEIGNFIADVLPRLLLGEPRSLALLFGAGSREIASRIMSAYPLVRDRVIGAGRLSQAGISVHLQACDLLLQPFPDGISSRRTSAMAGLAHGLPIVTTKGALTEALWSDAKCVAMTAFSDREGFVRLAQGVLHDTARRSRMGQRARDTYNERFALKHAVATLRSH